MVIGYKVFSKGLKRRDGFQYKEGRTYFHAGDISLHHGGFYFCQLPHLVDSHYLLDDSTEYAVIQILGRVIHGKNHSTDLSVTNKMKIIKVLTRSEFMCHVADGPHKLPSGNIYWLRCGVLHRDGDLPAVIKVSGHLSWYYHGRLYIDGISSY
jgi:hypothetical protein